MHKRACHRCYTSNNIISRYVATQTGDIIKCNKLNPTYNKLSPPLVAKRRIKPLRKRNSFDRKLRRPALRIALFEDGFSGASRRVVREMKE